jgi:hypothetical protein
MVHPAGEMAGEELDIAGDAAAMTEVAAVLSTFQPIPLDAVRQNSADFAAMLEWFESTGYHADIPALERRFGPLITLADWARTLRWHRPPDASRAWHPCAGLPFSCIRPISKNHTSSPVHNQSAR